jgi:SAM-dependent methyltransferase
VYDKLATLWEKKGNLIFSVWECDNPLRARLLEIIESLARKAHPLVLLELGQGVGKELMQASFLMPSGWVIGIDSSYEMCKRTADRLAQRPEASKVKSLVIYGDASDTLLPSRVADVVIIKMVLHRNPTWKAILREAARVVGPGGRVLAQVPSIEHYTALWSPDYPGRPGYRLPGPGQYREHPEGRGFTAAELMAACAACGLSAEVSTITFKHGILGWLNFLDLEAAKGSVQLQVTDRFLRRALESSQERLVWSGSYLLLQATREE